MHCKQSSTHHLLQDSRCDLMIRIGLVQVVFGVGEAEAEAAQAHTTNDAFNKLATMLRYLCSEGDRLQKHVRYIDDMFHVEFSAPPSAILFESSRCSN